MQDNQTCILSPHLCTEVYAYTQTSIFRDSSKIVKHGKFSKIPLIQIYGDVTAKVITVNKNW